MSTDRVTETSPANVGQETEPIITDEVMAAVPEPASQQHVAPSLTAAAQAVSEGGYRSFAGPYDGSTRPAVQDQPAFSLNRTDENALPAEDPRYWHWEMKADPVEDPESGEIILRVLAESITEVRNNG